MFTEGHLRMPNSVVERLAQLRLTGTQWQLLWAVWRLTLCWQIGGEWKERSYPIGIQDLVDLTHLGVSQVKRELKVLVDLHIILRDPSSGGRGNKPLTSFNLDYSTWQVPDNGKGSISETLLKRVADSIPFEPQKGNVSETLLENGKGSEDETLYGTDLRPFPPERVADLRPFHDENETLSTPNLASWKETLNKHTTKETKETHGDGISETLKELTRCHEEYVGVIGFRDAERIREFSDFFDSNGGKLEWIEKGFSAAEASKRRWPYIQAILERYLDNGGPDGTKRQQRNATDTGNSRRYSSDEYRRSTRRKPDAL